MKEKKFVKKTFTFTGEMIEKMRILKEKHNHISMVETMRACINCFWKDTFKYGSMPVIGSNGSIMTSVEDKAKKKIEAKMAEKKAEENMKNAPRIYRCVNVLKGEVITNPNGSQVCHWQTHDVNESYDQTIAIEQCGEYLEDGLFIPDRETVLSARPDLYNTFK